MSDQKKKLIKILASYSSILGIVAGSYLNINNNNKKTYNLERTDRVEVASIEYYYNVVDKEETTKETKQILKLINNNANISNEEKIFIDSLDKLLNDSSSVFDMKVINERLANLKIKHEESTDIFKAGTYSPTENSITIFDNKKFNLLSEEEQGVLAHEFLHSITLGIDLSTAFNEGCTEMISKEYLNRYSLGIYQNQQTIVRMLCEIIGPNIVRESYFKGDDLLIVNALTKNNPLLAIDALHLFKLMDNQLSLERKYKREQRYSNYSGKEHNDIKKEIINNKKEIIELISKFYELHKKCSVTEDQLMLAYFDDLNDNTNISNSKLYINGDTENIAINKSYFNNQFNDNDNIYALYEYNSTIISNLNDDAQYYAESTLNYDRSRKILK